MEIVHDHELNHNIFKFSHTGVSTPAVLMFDTDNRLLLRVGSEEEVVKMDQLNLEEYTRYRENSRIEDGLNLDNSYYFHHMKSMLNLAREKIEIAHNLNAIIHLVVRNHNPKARLK